MIGSALGRCLEPVYLIKCDGCGTAQLCDGIEPEIIGEDLAAHGWVMIYKRPWCPDCAEDALAGHDRQSVADSEEA